MGAQGVFCCSRVSSAFFSIVATVLASFRVFAKMLATSMPSPFAVVKANVGERLYNEFSQCGLVLQDGDSEGSTDVENDDNEDDCISVSSSCSSLPRDRIVGFADEVANGVLEEVVEVESFKEYNKFTMEDKAQADKEWCEKVLEKFDIEEQGVACLQGVVVELAVSACGYEAVQQAFEISRGEDQTILLGEIRGHVRHLASSLYGAEVLQTCLELMRPAAVSFIATELTGVAARVARSAVGHAVLCRILEHLPQKHTASLLEELSQSVVELSCHQYASLVVSHLIDYSSRPYQLHMCRMITLHEKMLRRHRSAIPLLRKAQLHSQAKLN